MNKRLAPNLAAAALVAAGFAFPADSAARDALLQIGLFALSGALTNWLAVYMLFERVPGLYGSGVIPLHFESFKHSINDLVTRELFSKDNVDKVLSGDGRAVDLEPALITLDMDALFEQLIEVIKNSSFGSVIGVVGGVAALEPLRAPFKKRMRSYLQKVVESPAFQQALRSQISGMTGSDEFIAKIRAVVQLRLDELTPEMVKDIVQRMIRDHLGWLVVWGAVFGGLIGLLTFLLLP